jgi:hypothetical protein
MRLILDDIIQDLKLRLREEKGIRNKVLLKDAIEALSAFRRNNEKKI